MVESNPDLNAMPPGFDPEQEAAMNEFINDCAFDTLVDSIGEAFD